MAKLKRLKKGIGGIVCRTPPTISTVSRIVQGIGTSPWRETVLTPHKGPPIPSLLPVREKLLQLGWIVSPSSPAPILTGVVSLIASRFYKLTEFYSGAFGITYSAPACVSLHAASCPIILPRFAGMSNQISAIRSMP